MCPSLDHWTLAPYLACSLTWQDPCIFVCPHEAPHETGCDHPRARDAQAPNFREAAAIVANQDLPTPVKFAKYDDADEYNRRLRAGAPDMYNFTAYPALFVFKEGKHEWFRGGRESHEIVDYMTAVAKGLDPIEEEKKSKPGLYKREPDFDPLLMAELDVDNFEAEVLENQNVVWIIEFYSDHCPICKSLAPEILKAAKEVYTCDECSWCC